MQKTTLAVAFRLTLLSLAFSAGVCWGVNAQQRDRINAQEIEINSSGISPPLVTTLDVNCPEGSVYRISSGTPDGACTAAQLTCANGAGTLVASTSCTTGCVSSRLTGSCTRVR